MVPQGDPKGVPVPNRNLAVPEQVWQYQSESGSTIMSLAVPEQVWKYQYESGSSSAILLVPAAGRNAARVSIPGLA